MRASYGGKVGAVFGLVLLAAPFVAPAAYGQTEAPDDGANEITSTPEGQDYLAAALDRFERNELNAGAAHPSDSLSLLESEGAPEYVVYDGIPGDEDSIWVVEVGEELPTVTDRDGSSTWNFKGESHVVDPGQEPLSASALADNGITWWPVTCWARFQPTDPNANLYGGWTDVCWQDGYTAPSSNNTTRDYVLKINATCGPNPNWMLTECQVGTRSTAGAAPLSWTAWAPAADSSGSCRDVSLGISWGPISVGGGFQGCEQIDITKGAVAPAFTSKWRTDIGGVFGERSVAMQIGFRSTSVSKMPAVEWFRGHKAEIPR